MSFRCMKRLFSKHNQVLQIKGNQLRVPIAGNPCFPLSGNLSVKDIKDQLSSAGGENVTLRMLDGINISKTTQARELLKTIFILEVGNE